ncbi:MAG: hypothetical protein HYU99_08425 [Deltaproteobacteria bacterium]|nr:hypothetical protein [Deltaproteobacteria bacterium]
MLDLSAQTKKLREVASKLFQKNRYERVINDLKELALQRPDDMRIKMRMAETWFRAKDIPRAIQTYREIADLFERQNFILKAAAIYKNILKLEPGLVEINVKLAELYQKLGLQADAVNQYRIMVESYSAMGDRDKMIATCRKLVELDPAPANRRKLGEIYQMHGMAKEAVEQYEALAREYRLGKQYDDLLRVYELILPHKGDNQALIKDICILYLRRQEPDHAIRTMERFKLDGEPAFADLYDKARQMREILRKQGGRP